MDSSDNGEEDADDAIEEDGRQISWWLEGVGGRLNEA